MSPIRPVPLPSLLPRSVRTVVRSALSRVRAASMSVTEEVMASDMVLRLAWAWSCTWAAAWAAAVCTWAFWPVTTWAPVSVIALACPPRALVDRSNMLPRVAVSSWAWADTRRTWVPTVVRAASALAAAESKAVVTVVDRVSCWVLRALTALVRVVRSVVSWLTLVLRVLSAVVRLTASGSSGSPDRAFLAWLTAFVTSVTAVRRLVTAVAVAAPSVLVSDRVEASARVVAWLVRGSLRVAVASAGRGRLACAEPGQGVLVR